MSIVYHVKEEELNENFFQSLKAFVKGKKNIRIEVEEELDETEYLKSSPVNEARLNEAINRIERGEGLKTVSPEDLNNLTK
jgi:hypothetical protein